MLGHLNLVIFGFCRSRFADGQCKDEGKFSTELNFRVSAKLLIKADGVGVKSDKAS